MACSLRLGRTTTSFVLLFFHAIGRRNVHSWLSHDLHGWLNSELVMLMADRAVIFMTG